SARGRGQSGGRHGGGNSLETVEAAAAAPTKLDEGRAIPEVAARPVRAARRRGHLLVPRVAARWAAARPQVAARLAEEGEPRPPRRPPGLGSALPLLLLSIAESTSGVFSHKTVKHSHIFPDFPEQAKQFTIARC